MIAFQGVNSRDCNPRDSNPANPRDSNPANPGDSYPANPGILMTREVRCEEGGTGGWMYIRLQARFLGLKPAL